MNYRHFLLIITASLMVSACSLWPEPKGPQLNTVQSSDYCGTKTPDAKLHYFASPEPLADYIAEREINEIRAGVASLAGVFIVEMGQRPTAGYSLEVIDGASRIEDGTLIIAMRWESPALDANVSQVLVSACKVIPRPKGNYDRVVLIDQRGEQRAEVTMP